MKYENIPNLNQNILDQFDSENDDEKIEALLSLVFDGNNYNFAMEKSMLFCQSNSESLKACGVLCFGHIARIYKKIDIENITEILKHSLKSDSEIIRGNANSAIDDLEVFLKIDKKIFQ